MKTSYGLKLSSVKS